MLYKMSVELSILGQTRKFMREVRADFRREQRGKQKTYNFDDIPEKLTTVALEVLWKCLLGVTPSLFSAWSLVIHPEYIRPISKRK